MTAWELDRIARRIRASARPDARCAPFRLAMMTDRSRLPEPEAILADTPPGMAVILRDYDLPQNARRSLARRLRNAIVDRAGRLYIGADPELARSVDAHGVHWPEVLTHLVAGARAAWPGLEHIAAAHGPAGLARADALRLDAALLSPVFPTASHPQAHAWGPLRWSRLAAEVRTPCIALGGVTPQRAKRLLGAPCAGLAGIGVFGVKS